MARAWTVALVVVLTASLVGCLPWGGKQESKETAGDVEIRVPVTEKQPTPPKPKPEEPKPEPEKPKIVTPEPEKPKIVTPKPEEPKPEEPKAPKIELVELKRGTGIDISPLFNNDAFSSEDNRKDADFDQWGQSFPAEELPDAGKFCKKELPACFLFPTKEETKKNNTACAGQTIPVAGKRQALHLLVTATDADQESTLTVEYADGKVQADLKVTDWCQEAKFKEAVAAETKHRVAVDANGQGVLSKEVMAARIWCVTIPLDAKRELKSVKLPYNAQIHIFALTLQ